MRHCLRPRCHTVLALGLSLVALPAHAADFYLGIGLGGGDVEANPREFVSSPDVLDESAGENVIANEAFAGFQFESGMLLELGYDEYDTFGLVFGPLLDGQIDYTAARLSVGLAPEPKGRFGFVGKLGLAFWDVELTESPFLNPGPEDRASRDGTALYGFVGGQFKLSEHARIHAGYDFTNTDAANVRSFKVSFRWLFGR